MASMPVLHSSDLAPPPPLLCSSFPQSSDPQSRNPKSIQNLPSSAARSSSAAIPVQFSLLSVGTSTNLGSLPSSSPSDLAPPHSNLTPAPPPPKSSRSAPSSPTPAPDPVVPLSDKAPPTRFPPILSPPPSQPLPHPCLASSSRPLLSHTPRISAPLHQQPSYAQVARGARGPGFVRSHASDVEAFARLPRTGINIICGSREGLPSFSFVNSDLPKVEELYSNALVMKFHGGRPSLESSHKEISSWGMENPFSIGPLTSRAFLLRFQDEKDLLKVLTRPSSTLISFPYKVFRWHNLCHLKEDSCIAPVWISLPRLPLQCFIPEFLESVANKIGRFLCLDKATATLARPSAARLCVEIDLRKPPPQFIWVGLFDGFKQPILYEKLPKFCNGCHIQGHSTVNCSKGPLDNPQQLVATRNQSSKSSTPSVRYNSTTKHNSANPPLQTSSSLHSIPTPTTRTPPFIASVVLPETIQVSRQSSDQHGRAQAPPPPPLINTLVIPNNHQSTIPPPNSGLPSAQLQPPPPPLHQSAAASAIRTDLELVDHGSATSSCNLSAGVSEEKEDLVPLYSDECNSQSSGPPGFSSKNTNFKEVNLDKEDSTSQSSGPPGFSTKIPKTKKKHSSKGGTVFSHRTHLKHFATSKKSSATSKRDNPNSTPFLPINSLSSDDFASIASNCGIKLPLSSDCFARLKALEIERSGADR